MVCVLLTPDGNVKVAADVTCFVRLKNVVGPESVWFVPFKTTVLVPLVKVPLFVQLPPTVKVFEPAMRVFPTLIVKCPLVKFEERVIVWPPEPTNTLPRSFMPGLKVKVPCRRNSPVPASLVKVPFASVTVPEEGVRVML